jgi:hypothetical protein
MTRLKVRVIPYWRAEPMYVEKSGDELWIGVKG